jgi:hypothetical protein
MEYYLKAGLSACLSLNDMRRFRHNLNKLWREYDEFHPGLDIDVRIISYINAFETTRYPGESKFVRTLRGTSHNELFSKVLEGASQELQQTLACFSLDDFDRIVRILRTSLPDGDRLPFMAVTDHAQTYLFHENKCFRKEQC